MEYVAILEFTAKGVWPAVFVGCSGLGGRARHLRFQSGQGRWASVAPRSSQGPRKAALTLMGRSLLWGVSSCMRSYAVPASSCADRGNGRPHQEGDRRSGVDGVAECGGTSSPCTGLCLLRIVDLAMGDYDCQRVAVAVHGVLDLSRQAATRLAYCVAGWLAPGGKSLAAAATGGGAGVPLRPGRVRGFNAPYGICERGRRSRSSWAIAK